MQQVRAFFGGGRSTEPDSSILAEWNKCAPLLACWASVPEVALLHTVDARFRNEAVLISARPCVA